MDDKLSQLPWQELWRTQGELPWPALETFADAVVAEPGLADELFKAYERAREVSLTKTCYADLYVPAIFALAAPRLDEDRRRMIGEFLVKKLAEAGEDHDDVMMEVLTGASGSMGPVIVLAVLDAIAAESDADGAWFHLWNLTALAAKAEDPVVRDQTVRACVGLLERADRGEIKPDEGMEAAHTLALLGRTEYTKMLERLGTKCEPFFGRADYEEAVQLLKGSADREEWPQAWEEPVREWFEPRWQTIRDWFARRGAEELEDVGSGLTVPGNMVRRFMKSQWVGDLPQDLFDDAPFITRRLLEYAETYDGIAPNELDEQTLCDVLLDLFPRKITGGRSFFAKVAPVVEALLEWMASEGILENGSALARSVHGWSEEIVDRAMEPENWGPAKTMTMEAERAGVDITDEEALQRFWYARALQSLEYLEQNPPDQTEQGPVTPTAPIVEHAPKIGRNDPCPCGSGRKYKKCCGSPTKGQAART
jgi:hypothetical protein